MRSILVLAFYLISFSTYVFSQCPKNTDNLYDRQKILGELNNILRSSIPAHVQSQSGFFVYDLTEPSNRFIPKPYASAKACVNFINGHAYHFSPIEFSISQSHVLFLEDGKLQVFKNINCGKSNDTLREVVDYANAKYENSKHKDEIITRIKNYRRYGFYITTDSYKVESCNDEDVIPANSDRLYDRDKVLRLLAGELLSSAPEEARNQLSSSRLLIERSRANGLFIYDLTEPANKQTSLLERIEFKNNHIYHFAFIDLPYSYSHIVILENGALKIFKSINCVGRGNDLKDVLSYLNQKLNIDDRKDEIIERVNNYRSHGVYASFNGLSAPQCNK